LLLQNSLRHSQKQLSRKVEGPMHLEAMLQTCLQITESQRPKGPALSPGGSWQPKRGAEVHQHGATSRLSRAHSDRASHQRFWSTTLVHVHFALLFGSVIQGEQVRRAVAHKRRLAAFAIQKLFRSKLMPYYIKQLAKAVATLKPWMADALNRWRQRRLHRSTDVLRQVLINCRNSNKLSSCIRAFRQKVVRIQRNIRSFLQCTQARVIRLIKLLHIQVGIGPPRMLVLTSLLMSLSSV
jgi:hypothetical protein